MAAKQGLTQPSSKSAKFRSKKILLALAVAAAIGGINVHRAAAGISYFNVTSGDYSLGTNWVNGLPSGTVTAEIGTVNGGFAIASANYTSATGITGAGLDVGDGGGALGSLTLSGSAGTLTYTAVAGAFFDIGANSGTGVVTVNAGTIADTGQAINVGALSGNGTLIINTGGTVTNNNDMVVATAGTGTQGTVTVGGGTLALTGTGRLIIADGNNANGTVTLNSGSISSASVIFGGGTGTSAGETGTFNLVGGTLTTGSVSRFAASGTYAFNFNGGTIAPSAASGNFLQANVTYNVQSGGAFFNVATGNDITVSQPLLHAGTLTLDGGLTKNGSGNLTLSNTGSTFTGNILVSAGTLTLSGGSGDIGALIPWGKPSPWLRVRHW